MQIRTKMSRIRNTAHRYRNVTRISRIRQMSCTIFSLAFSVVQVNFCKLRFAQCSCHGSLGYVSFPEPFYAVITFGFSSFQGPCFAFRTILRGKFCIVVDISLLPDPLPTVGNILLGRTQWVWYVMTRLAICEFRNDCR